MSGISKLVTNGLQFVKSAIQKSGGVTIVPLKQLEEEPGKITGALNSLASIGQTQIHRLKGELSPDVAYLKKLTDKYRQTEEQISQTRQDVLAYLKKISLNLEETAMSMECDGYEETMAKKSVIDYLIEHIRYNEDCRIGRIGFEFGLPTKKITSDLTGFQKEFDKSVSCCKKEGILSASDYDFKKHQFDAEDIMKKMQKLKHNAKQKEYDGLFNPIARLREGYGNDLYLNDDANFYRIISPGELVSLIKTKQTKALIDSNGHFTNGHYSCITTNPNYNEQAFSANGLPIRLKFKTKDKNGLYNMNLLNRICGLKKENSVYRISGYNFDDIDWDNVCVDLGNGWEWLDEDQIEELIKIVLG